MIRDSHDRFDFGPSDDQYRSFDTGEEETARGPLILALAAGVLIVFAAVVWNTYRQGVRDGSGGVPLITADAGPYKRQPDDAGGVPTPNLDTRLYDEMDGSERTEPEEPEAGEILQGGPPLELRPEFDDGTSDPETGMPNALSEEVRRLADLEGRPDEIDESGVDLAAISEAPLPAPAQTPEAPPEREPGPEPRFDFDPRGKYLVQIAAFRDPAAAESAWTQAVAENEAIFRGAGRDIQRADLGARGTFYRLRASAFADRDTAGEFCAALKAAGSDCIVVQR